jgi:small conductance mechanosensitive channel
VLDDEKLSHVADWLLGPPLKILAILVLASVANWVGRRAVKRSLTKLHSGAVRELDARKRTPAALLETGETSVRAEQRIDALSSVLRSVLSFVIWATAALMCLGEVGIDLGPLIAGAGVLGVAIGFGSQSLVRDFLSGAFILVEDQFGVGEIRRVGNMSQHWSRALLDIEVAYDTVVAHARSVIKRVADAVWAEDDGVLEEPELWGVEQLGANGVMLRLVVKTTPSQQWRVSRELRERIKVAFDEEGIEIPFPQQTVWHKPAEVS